MVPDRAIAVCSLSCRFPDAASPRALWQNLMEGRISFRAIPPQRLNLSDYTCDGAAPSDSITPVCAGLLTGWSFDRSRFKVSKATFEVTDLAHWLALELANEALEAVGGVERMDRDGCAVVVGNTLTGEFSRTSLLRLRQPFLDRLLDGCLRADGICANEAQVIRTRFAKVLKQTLPEPTEDSLAGALSNTIAGRIANYFDLRGGAFSVDGACASSHVALSIAGDLLRSGRVTSVLVGAVDLSLDPLELVGFSRNGALAVSRMRVFDRSATGFWPAEGGAFALLMDAHRAAEKGFQARAHILGWGISTDGAGGLTRPSVEGQNSAITRAIADAGVAANEVSSVEAHGTGTKIGDAVEIEALAKTFRGRQTALPIGSVKANIGHAKAAAGFAGLAKVVESLVEGCMPPHVGCDIAHPAFAASGLVEPVREPVVLPEGAVVGLSGFGFGGINGHLILRAATPPQRRQTCSPAPKLRFQSHELFLLAGRDKADLRERLVQLREASRFASVSDMVDLARDSFKRAREIRPLRAAIVGANPRELLDRIEAALSLIDNGSDRTARPGLHVGLAPRAPRLFFLFPGQSSPTRGRLNAWSARWPHLQCDYPLHQEHDESAATEIAQPAIMAASLAALAGATAFALQGAAALGHSMGEIAAYTWAGIYSPTQALKIAERRGRIMAQHGAPGGAMARLAARTADVAEAVDAACLEIACENAPEETVVSGPAGAVDAFLRTMAGRGVHGARLQVSHAFHSVGMAPAQYVLHRELSLFSRLPPARTLFSTVTGRVVTEEDDPARLLVEQLVSRVRFTAALERAAKIADVFVELGPGQGLTRLVELSGYRGLSLDAMSDDLFPLLSAVGELFVLGTDVELGWLFDDRPSRATTTFAAEDFLSSPCGVPEHAPSSVPLVATAAPRRPPQPTEDPVGLDQVTVMVRRALADQMGLAERDIKGDLRLMSNLHLNSLTVGRLVGDLATQLGIASVQRVTDLGAVTVDGLAAYLIEMRDLGGAAPPAVRRVEGVDNWVRCFTRQYQETELQDVIDLGAPAPQWSHGDETGLDPELAEHDGPAGMIITVEHDIRFAAAEALWSAVKRARESGNRHLAIVHGGLQLSGFARSLLAEDLFETIRLIDLGVQGAAQAGVARLLKGLPKRRFADLKLDQDGTLSAATMVLHTPQRAGSGAMLDASDLILVTGGAQGIGAECALTVGLRTGARLLLVGRTPGQAAKVQATLARMKAAGVTASYVSIDMTDYHRATVKLAECELRLGKITAIIHAAGTNEPIRFEDVGPQLLESTFAPKLEGLESILTAVDAANIKVLVGFGSLIAHTGLAGEAHYALANAYMASRMAVWADEPAHRRRPPRHLCLDWSVWSGAGMGERLGVLDRFTAMGVDPIGLGDGLAAFERLLCESDHAGNLVVTSRFGPPGSSRIAGRPVAQHRFLENILIHTPGVEIVVECELSLGSDPYLADHVIEGVQVMPAVLLLEAMVQGAQALANLGTELTILDTSFDKAVMFDRTATLRLRIAALVREDGSVETTIRSSMDNFAQVHARARFLPSAALPATLRQPPDTTAAELQLAADSLYGSIFFGRRRFERLIAYRSLSATRVDALINSGSGLAWFGAYLSQELLLGDPGARDAGLHALMATIPQCLVLPTSVERITILDVAQHRYRVVAIQTAATADSFMFDIHWCSESGALLEIWQNVRLQRVRNRALVIAEPGLTGVCLEREIQLRTGRTDVRICLTRGNTRAQGRTRALELLGLGKTSHRADGKPACERSGTLSLAHAGEATLIAHAPDEVAVDVVAPDQEPSLDIGDRAMARGPQRREIAQALWGAREACRKSGHPPSRAIALVDITPDGRGAMAVGDHVFVFIARPELGMIGALVRRTRRATQVTSAGGNG